MKKQTTTLLLLAAAGAAAYFIIKNKGAANEKFVEEPTEGGETEDISATVTAAPGQIQAAIEKATEIASTVKDAAIAVTDGTKTAIVTSGKAKRQARRLENKAKRAAKRAERKKRRAGKWTQAQLEQYCTNKGETPGTRKFKRCVRQSRKLKSMPFVEPTQSNTF